MADIKNLINGINEIIQDEADCTAGLDEERWERLRSLWEELKEIVQNG